MSTTETTQPQAIDLTPGNHFANVELPDHTGRVRRLSEIAAGNPLALFTARGWWCPKEQRYMRELAPACCAAVPRLRLERTRSGHSHPVGA